MNAPHLQSRPGAAADFGAHLASELPRIATARTILRAPRLDDAPAWIEILQADTEGHMGGPFGADAAFTDFAACIGMWLLRGHGLWTLTDHDDQVLGFVLIGFEPGDQAPELGYLLRDPARRQGFATEAAQAVRDHGFGTMGLSEMVSYISEANLPSRRVAERLGARQGPPLPDGTTVWHHTPSMEIRQ